MGSAALDVILLLRDAVARSDTHHISAIRTHPPLMGWLSVEHIGEAFILLEHQRLGEAWHLDLFGTQLDGFVVD